MTRLHEAIFGRVASELAVAMTADRIGFEQLCLKHMCCIIFVCLRHATDRTDPLPGARVKSNAHKAVQNTWFPTLPHIIAGT